MTFLILLEKSKYQTSYDKVYGDSDKSWMNIGDCGQGLSMYLSQGSDVMRMLGSWWRNVEGAQKLCRYHVVLSRLVYLSNVIFPLVTRLVLFVDEKHVSKI